MITSYYWWRGTVLGDLARILSITSNPSVSSPEQRKKDDKKFSKQKVKGRHFQEARAKNTAQHIT